MSQLKRRFQLVTAPSEQPVSLADVKSYLKIDHNDEDAVITSLIAAATGLVEQFLNIRLVTQTVKITVDSFPESQVLPLGIGPLQSVNSLKTIDRAGVTDTVSNTIYKIGNKQPHGSLVVAESADWPATELRADAGVEVEAVVGYGAAAAVPQIIKGAIFQTVAGLYENRGDINLKLSPMALTLLAPYRVYP